MEKCYCEELRRAVDNGIEKYDSSTYYVYLDTEGGDTALYLQYNYKTRNYELCGSGGDNSYIPIQYCPFCGKLLKKIKKK